MTQDFKLPSGAELKVTASSFSVSKALFQAMLEELKALKLNLGDDEANLYKDIFCAGFSSKKVEGCLAECMKRATYNNVKLSDEIFENEEARGDYLTVCFEVARVNVSPFTKSLFAQFSRIKESLRKSLA